MHDFASRQSDARGCTILQIEVQGKLRQMHIHVITDRRDTLHELDLKKMQCLLLGYLLHCFEFILTFNLCLTKQEPHSLEYWHILLNDTFEIS